MKIEENSIQYIKEHFHKIQSKNDLLELLNYSKKIIYGKDSEPIELKSLLYYANSIICKKRYKTFTIKKKSGKDRIINAPVDGLKIILRSLNLIFQCMYKPNNLAFGFVQGASIADNARKHVSQLYVYNIDLKDFFHSFDRNRVKLGLMRSFFNFDKDKEPIAYFLSRLCTYSQVINGTTMNVLPQGSPTSPTLTNIICTKLDKRLNGLAKRFGAKYSRYADDITFSSMSSIFKNKEFIDELHRIISEDNRLIYKNKDITIGPKLIINSDKTRLQKNVYRQEVTGLIVNEKVNVPRRYVKEIRMWLYYWEKYGFLKVSMIYSKKFVKDNPHLIATDTIENTMRLLDGSYLGEKDDRIIKKEFESILRGKLLYLKMIKGENDSTFISLKNRYNKLIGQDNYVNETLDIWEKEGIKKAIGYYCSFPIGLSEKKHLIN